MVIGALIHANGSHPASWLMDEARPHASTDIDYYGEMARLAERGKFDFFFIADTPAARTENLNVWSRSPLFMNVLEPITLLSATENTYELLAESNDGAPWPMVSIPAPGSTVGLNRNTCGADRMAPLRNTTVSSPSR